MVWLAGLWWGGVGLREVCFDEHFICLFERALSSAFQFNIILSFFSNTLLFKEKLYEGLAQKSHKVEKG